MATSLIATVGGTVEPLIKTIIEHSPKYICFLCSHDSVEKVPEIKAAIRSQIGAIDFSDQKIIVDDINDLIHCYSKAKECIHKLEEWGVAAADTVIDYTGGTKSMSVALGLATVQHGYTFSYVGGFERTKEGLGVVVSGTEVVRAGINPWSLFAIDERRHIAEFFNLYQFAAAERIVNDLLSKSQIDGRLRKLLEAIKPLCIGYSAWDRFVHKEALEQIKNGAAQLATFIELSRETKYRQFSDSVNNNLAWLQQLQRDTQGFRKAARLQVADLVSNAARRAEEGKFDDAVARLYRALEMDGQVALAEPPLSVESASDVPAAKIPESLREEYLSKYCDEGKIKLGLYALFNLLAEVKHERGIVFIEQIQRIRSVMSARNNSILAHGSTPIAEKTYLSLKEVLTDNLKLADNINFARMPSE